MSIGIIIPSWASPIIVLLASTSVPVFVPVPAKHTPFDVVVFWSVYVCVGGSLKTTATTTTTTKQRPPYYLYVLTHVLLLIYYR